MLVLQANAAIQTFSMGAGDVNSDWNVYKTSTLSTEPSPQLLHRTLSLTNFTHIHCLTVIPNWSIRAKLESVKSQSSLAYLHDSHILYVSMWYKYVIVQCDVTLKSYRTKETKQSLPLRGKENWYYWSLTITQEMPVTLRTPCYWVLQTDTTRFL